LTDTPKKQDVEGIEEVQESDNAGMTGLGK
jgi:hypothetical protein